jgi:hypothetical protein
MRDLSAMPPSLLNPEIEEIFTQIYQIFEREDRLLCFETSVSRDIRIVPIRPEEKTEVKQPVFYPDRLMGFNVSSNPGLIYVLRSVFNETSDRSNYRILVSDCNVFLRAIKVKSIFSSSSSHLSLLSVIISVLVDVHLLNNYSFPPLSLFPHPPCFPGIPATKLSCVITVFHCSCPHRKLRKNPSSIEKPVGICDLFLYTDLPPEWVPQAAHWPDIDHVHS